MAARAQENIKTVGVNKAGRYIVVTGPYDMNVDCKFQSSPVIETGTLYLSRAVVVLFNRPGRQRIIALGEAS